MTTIMLTVIMTMIVKSNAAQVYTQSVHRGEAVQLTSDLQELDMGRIQDIRWTHLHLSLSNNSQRTGCNGRCELLNDGTLRFSEVESNYKGSFIQEVFDSEGKLLKKTEIILNVETDGSSDLNHIYLSFILFLLFPLIVVAYFILKRRSKRIEVAATGPTQENTYEVMHSFQNKIKEEVEEQKVEEIKPSMPIEQQLLEEDNVYM